MSESVSHEALMRKLESIEGRLIRVERFQIYVRAVVSVIGLVAGIGGWLLYTADSLRPLLGL